MKQHRSALTLVEALAVIFVLGLLVALMLPAIRSAREPARRNQCLNHAKQISLALHNYHDANVGFPAAFTVGEEGRTLHGWRTRVLPLLEEASLFEKVDLSQAWNAPSNQAWGSLHLEAYECLSSPQEEVRSNYLAVVGEGFAFPSVGRTTFEDFLDGTAKSLLFTEEAVERVVPWFKPEDSDESRFLHQAETFSMHPGVHVAAFADGHVETLSDELAPEVRRAMLTIAGGEKITLNDW